MKCSGNLSSRCSLPVGEMVRHSISWSPFARPPTRQRGSRSCHARRRPRSKSEVQPSHRRRMDAWLEFVRWLARRASTKSAVRVRDDSCACGQRITLRDRFVRERDVVACQSHRRAHRPGSEASLETTSPDLRASAFDHLRVRQPVPQPLALRIREIVRASRKIARYSLQEEAAEDSASREPEMDAARPVVRSITTSPRRIFPMLCPPIASRNRR